MGKKIKVLIIDDSLVFREVLSRGISTDPMIDVVAKAEDPFDARDKILEFEPDVITCDVEMPKMNGIEFIRRLLPQYPVPTIVVSSVSSAVFDAMDAGAVDFVTKPNVQSAQSVESFIRDLINKVKTVNGAKIVTSSSEHAESVTGSHSFDQKKIIAIGASTGGTEAISALLKQLPAQMPAMVIVQHIPPLFSKMFADRLNSLTPFSVKEAATGDYLEPGKILIAPGDQHITIKRIADKYKIEAFQGEKVNGHCPSVDVLFHSVAKECGENAIGVILTGMGYDGAKGLLSMRRSGARTIGQDQASSVVYGMPKVAYDVGAVVQQAPLQKIPGLLCAMLR